MSVERTDQKVIGPGAADIRVIDLAVIVPHAVSLISAAAVSYTHLRYQKGFGMIRDELNLNPEHRPHDGRKHFVTMAKKYGVDEYAIRCV